MVVGGGTSSSPWWSSVNLTSILTLPEASLSMENMKHNLSSLEDVTGTDSGLQDDSLLPFLLNGEFESGRNYSSVTDLVNKSGGVSTPGDIGAIISYSSMTFVFIYCILFVTGAVGNLSVFLSVGHELRKTSRRSRIKVLILHLSMADLFVIFFVIPIEVFWRLTIFWYGGDTLCKICQFFRAFGLFLSSNVIICISLDRFYVIISPLKAIGGMRRVKNMLFFAWMAAVLFAAPQCIVFSVRRIHKNVEQCAIFDYFESIEDEFLYRMMSVSAMYFAPLTVILFTYVGVLIKVSRRSRDHQTANEFQRRILQQRINRSAVATGVQSQTDPSEGLMVTSRILLKRIFARETTSINNGHNNLSNGGASGAPVAAAATTTATVAVGGVIPNPSGQSCATNVSIMATRGGSSFRRGSQFLRMSDTATCNINRSRRQAFFLTMLIITVFVICWTPYVAITLWYTLDYESAKVVDGRVHEAFFTMAVSNSCLNPMIYGNYVRRFYYSSCTARRRDTSVLSAEEQRSAGRLESCDVRHF